MRSRDVINQIEVDGWAAVRQNGIHRHFRHPTKPGTVTVPHPRRTLSAPPREPKSTPALTAAISQRAPLDHRTRTFGGADPPRFPFHPPSAMRRASRNPYPFS
ncbi:MAG: type II toxin-antitoxin system HicA family toxin, partial [Sphingomonas sp.]|nr:type II toxin-antitoxin system HicA family toxin [Sphingomonas sp.]